MLIYFSSLRTVHIAIVTRCTAALKISTDNLLNHQHKSRIWIYRLKMLFIDFPFHHELQQSVSLSSCDIARDSNVHYFNYISEIFERTNSTCFYIGVTLKPFFAVDVTWLFIMIFFNFSMLIFLHGGSRLFSAG